jgi:hypothetical protein
MSDELQLVVPEKQSSTDYADYADFIQKVRRQQF